MQQIDVCVIDDQPPPPPSRDYSVNRQQALMPSSPELPDAALRSFFSGRSHRARQSFAGRLTHDPEFAATRAAVTEAAHRRHGAYQAAKRGADLLIAATLLIALMPLYLLIALAIVLDSRGSVLYYQYRVGRDGVPFRFYKFRSMVWNADALKAHLASRNEASGPIFKMRNDPRVTRIGALLRRFSLDELPQLINVLRGDTSMIGPRPLVVPEALVCDERQQMRHTVPPGLLCLREISGRSALSFTEWMELDLLYVANRSLLTDLRVLLIAVPVVLAGKGAY